MPKKKTVADTTQTTLPFPSENDEHLNISTLETWLWDAACVIRGATDAPKFKDFILPLIFYKRLSDVFDDEFAGHIEKFGDEAIAREITEADHADALKRDRDDSIVRFYIPQKYSWEALRNHPANGNLGQFVTDAMRDVARRNPRLQGVLDVEDFNERQSGQRIIDDERLEKLIEVINQHRLGLEDAEPDILGRAYEYLLRKFAEGQGQSAGEFYTPKEVGWLMAHLLNPEPYTTIYDPACGSGGLLIKPRLLFEQAHPDEKSQAPQIYGQELTPTTYAMAKMNAFLHDFIGADIQIGDTFRNPRFVENNSSLQRFDYVVANPMWNQERYDSAFYENDNWNRFTYGIAPNSSADWAWVQHILASLKENGRAAIVLGTAAVTRGSGGKPSDKEKVIRKKFLEEDLIEAVILLPEDLFYNTDAPGIVLLINKNKGFKNEILLINASEEVKEGKPKNFLSNEGIDKILDAYTLWKNVDFFSKVVTLDEITAFDYNLRPSKYIYKKVKREIFQWNKIIDDYQTALSESNQSIVNVDKILKTSDEKHTKLKQVGRWMLPQHWELRELRELVEEHEERARDLDFEILSCSKIFGVILQKEKFNSRVASVNTGKYKIVRPGMFVYDPMLLWDGSIGRNNYDFPGIVSPAYSVFKVTNENINSRYLEYILRSPFLIPEYIAISDGTNKRRKKAKFADFLSIVIPIPSSNEQEMISHLGENVDRIKKLEVKAEKLLRTFFYKMFPEV